MVSPIVAVFAAIVSVSLLCSQENPAAIIIFGDLLFGKYIIPNFAPASSIRQGRSILQPAILSRVFFSISLANSAFLLGFRDNISFGITVFVPNSGQRGQAGLRGTHEAKLDLPPWAGGPILHRGCHDALLARFSSPRFLLHPNEY